jgi:hypothetical protein
MCLTAQLYLYKIKCAFIKVDKKLVLISKNGTYQTLITRLSQTIQVQPSHVLRSIDIIFIYIKSTVVPKVRLYRPG